MLLHSNDISSNCRTYCDVFITVIEAGGQKECSQRQSFSSRARAAFQNFSVYGISPVNQC